MGPRIEELQLFDLESVPARPQLVGGKLDTPPHRRFHAWTADKLQVLDLYLKMYGRVAGGGTYIDGFSGTGVSFVNGKENDGSPVIAYKRKVFKRIYCFDGASQLTDLEGRFRYLYGGRYRSRITFHPGDVNVELPTLLRSGEIPKEKPCFAFLDPNGTELLWSTVEELAGYKSLDPAARPPQCKVEIWALFNSGQVMTRMWPRDHSNHPVPPAAQVFDRVFGSREAWWDLWVEHQPATQLVVRYQDMFRHMGYGAVNLYELRRPGTSQLQYHMVHATDHAAAVSFMAWAQGVPTADIPKEPQLRLADARGQVVRTAPL